MYLITGGAGFIGSCLAQEIQDRGLDDYVLVDWIEETTKWQNVQTLSPWAIVSPPQIMDFLEHDGEKIKGIFHLGAISATTETDGDLIYETNVILTRVLMEWAAEREVPFIYASSAATYGGGENGFEDREDLEYLQKLLPLNAYGWSKNLFDINLQQMKARGMTLPPQVAGLKFFNVYGPREGHKGGQSSVPFHIFNQVKATGGAKLFKSHHPDYKDGGQLRDFVYVKDCVDVMLWLLENPSVSGLFNVGTGTARTFKDLAKATFAALEKPEKIEYIPTPEQIREKYQYYTCANMEKLRQAGYDKPFTSLEKGIQDYVQSYLAQGRFLKLEN